MAVLDGRRQRQRAAGPLVLDGLLALAAASTGVALLATVQPLEVGSPRSVAAYLLVLAHTLPLAVRRRWPAAVLAVGLVTGAAFALLGFNLVVLPFARLVYVYTVATRCPRRVSLAGLAATEATIVLVWLARPRAIGSDASTLVLDGLILAAAWWLGDGTRRRQEAVVTAEQRAAELEQAREELARRAVTEERLRIARELHDVVAHSMSIIAVQSGVGVHVLDTRPEEARKALVAVELPAGLDLSAYRIVQEALTNMVRHAGPATARVTVRHAPGQVAVEVVDDGGGAVEAGPLPGGGFRVAATLPVEEPLR